MALMTFEDLDAYAEGIFDGSSGAKPATEDQIKGHSKVNDMGPWEALAADLLDKSDGSRELKKEMEDDRSIADDDGIGLSAGDAQCFTDDGGTNAEDAKEWESVDPKLVEMFVFLDNVTECRSLSDILDENMDLP